MCINAYSCLAKVIASSKVNCISFKKYFADEILMVA